MIHIWRPWKIHFARPPIPLTHLRLKFLPPSWPWDVHSSPNNNESIKRKSNDGCYMLSSLFFRSTLVFSINSLILSGFPLTSFHLAEASLSAFFWLYTLVCAVVHKYHEMSFINNSHFQYSFCSQPVSVIFAQLENVNKL